MECIRKSGRILAACHREISSMMGPGITTKEINASVERFLEKHAAYPEQKGYKGFPYATCASVNEVVCHGFPDERPLQAGMLLLSIWWLTRMDGWLIRLGLMP